MAMNQGLSEDIKSFTGRKSTIDFIRCARKFVVLIETPHLTSSDFFKSCHTALIDLYWSGHHLEQIPLKYSDSNSEFDEDKLFDAGGSPQIPDLGDEGWYWKVFDPTTFEKPVYDVSAAAKDLSNSWLIDDLTDIYRDLKIGLGKIDYIGSDEAVEDALWNMKWSFLNHWGLHCIDALRYLHYLCYDGKHVM